MVFGKVGVFIVKALAIFSAVIAPLPVEGHGYLAKPMSRNLIAHNKGLEYDEFPLMQAVLPRYGPMGVGNSAERATIPFADGSNTANQDPFRQNGLQDNKLLSQ
ncbi:hypothetical protein ATCV1_Z372R [Acanthocystis turfacea chlorella virus 1]|uniref:Uncharacterized protein Z372R n=1 Tax=Chlorovirus heliozoae TaxID=322019 RepID=A7K8Y2_9PHYC|nr:hypothetical protein ATCV1_Z372R [Acanthocystis turfacea chlorella virus 1]ABT16506.1 hypothetical protein ATCV1_Z372R [Acanthocystis turfacea chlorella virus 1]